MLSDVERKFQEYVREIREAGQGEFFSRSQVAQHFEVSYSTAKYHLERAVRAGALRRVPGYVGNQPGWCYCLPDTQPRLIADE